MTNTDTADIDGTVGNSADGGLLTVTGTLSGSGFVHGNVLVNGVHAPGNTTGFGNLSLLGGSLLDVNGLALDGATRGSFSLFQSGQDVSLRFTAVAVPEPSTVAMALAGLAYGGFSMWRRRLKANVA
jgi:hypothetical protein